MTYRGVHMLWRRLQMYISKPKNSSFDQTLEKSWRMLAGHRMGEPPEEVEKHDFLTGWQKIPFLTKQICDASELELCAEDLALKMFDDIDIDCNGLISKIEFKSWCWSKYKEKKPCRL